MAQVMTEVVAPENKHPNIDPAMTSEDFGFMLQQVPGAYGWIGNGKNGQRGTSLHHPGYDFNDDNIALGARFWDTLARRWLEQSSARPEAAQPAKKPSKQQRIGKSAAAGTGKPPPV